MRAGSFIFLTALVTACTVPAAPGLDAGPAIDGGERSDAGTVDAGATDDAGNDAGANADAGPGDDAGERADAGQATPSDYDTDGAEAVQAFDVGVTTDLLHSFTVHVFLPATDGPRPLVSLSPGLLQNANAYDAYAQRLASHGIAAVTRDDPGVLSPTTDVTADILYVVSTWLPAENADAASPLFGRVDLARIGLAGHSRGGKASLIAAENGAGIAWFGLDPVDAAEFSGGVQAREHLADIHVPTAFLGMAVSSSCSPASDNYQVLFAGMPSPSVALTGVNAGHTDLESADQCTFCGGCTPHGTADPATVLHYSVRYVTAFFARELLGDAAVGAGFEGAGVSEDIAAGLVTVEAK